MGKWGYIIPQNIMQWRKQTTSVSHIVSPPDTKQHSSFLTGAFYIIQCIESTEVSTIHLCCSKKWRRVATERDGGGGEFQGARNVLFLICVLIRSVLIRSGVKSQQALYPEDTYIYILFCMYSPKYLLFILKLQLKTCYFDKPWEYPTVISHFLLIFF